MCHETCPWWLRALFGVLPSPSFAGPGFEPLAGGWGDIFAPRVPTVGRTEHGKWIGMFLRKRGNPKHKTEPLDNGRIVPRFPQKIVNLLLTYFMPVFPANTLDFF